jgi:hypothetical protein
VSDASQTQDVLGLAHALHEIARRQPVLFDAASTIDLSVDATGGSWNFRSAAPAPGQH